ncbi:MAG: saccharopine dehydrogenase NADP-binding domain-containing protein [Candidatus Riflebacteria bacterium]|nr:saccharopine dehydrogenase NADP-binding domain-containing protein [Candidatus Riflebacteria bacterium]
MGNQKSIVVLGAGMVGAVMAEDLARESSFRVTVADRDGEVLSRLAARASVKTVIADLADQAKVRELIGPADLVIGAVPGYLGFQTLKLVIESGKNFADIAFMPEDYLQLDGLAVKKKVTAVVDCGVAPGMSNLILGKHAAEFDSFEEALILVGGLPRVRTWPYEYKAPFSPIDVLEEYTRPARYVRDGNIVNMPALTEPELVDLPGVGTLEAFNTDGLRSLIDTIRCPNMKEKTLRFPGHIEIMRILRETGFFSKTPIDVKGHNVAPLDLTTRLLFPKWKLQPGEEEFTVMRVQVTGTHKGDRIRHTYDLLDRNDPRTGFSSMSRTTGFPNAIMARLILNGSFESHGVFPPERFGGQPKIFQAIVDGLQERGVVFSHQEEKLALLPT